MAFFLSTGGAEGQSASCDCGSTPGTVTGLELQWNGVTTESFHDALAMLTPLGCSLKRLKLEGNRLAGYLPGTALALFRNVTRPGLSSNRLTGPVPQQLGTLPLLRVLDLTKNDLSGPVPKDLCLYNRSSPSRLIGLMLSSNRLNGTSDVPYCGALVNLDIGNNMFESFGNFTGWRSLQIMRWNNQTQIKSQPILPSMVDSEPLVDWSAASSGLTGPIPAFVAAMTALGAVNLGRNQLTGTLPSDLFINAGSLVSLNLAVNQLTGTLPPEMALTPSHSYKYQRNLLHGTIPEVFHKFVKPGFEMRLDNNHLFCCGTGTTGSGTSLSYTGVNYSAPRLPSFLRQSTLKKHMLLEPEFAALEDSAGLSVPVAQWGAMR
ncbi:hypothetical protein FOA52_003021 [Chlamydomonas sp. UWO 241]|nr:hypothetical protein FOA52_003021 [Chlamydomonas sp. UWO 241]